MSEKQLKCAYRKYYIVCIIPVSHSDDCVDASRNSVNTQSLEQDNASEIATRLLGENAQCYDMKSRLLPNSGISLLSLGDNENYCSVSSDEIGNITSYKGSTYTWVGRQLQSVSNEDYTSTFSYNSDGQRIGKTISVNGDSTYNYEYYYNGDILSGYKLVITDEEGQASTHIVTFMYDENGEAFGFNYNGNDYYYARNAQNDVVFITDSDNIGVVLYQYDAWGNITACADVSDGGMVSIVNPYTYRGYFYEIETNSYFLKSRYYNPELCRFISADGIVNANQDILGNNLYAYCSNNPIKFYDPTGHSIALLMTAIIPACIIACVAIIGIIGIASAMDNTAISVGIGNAIDNVSSNASVAVDNIKNKSQSKKNSKAKSNTDTSSIQRTKNQRPKAIFPVNPYDFSPKGLVRLEFKGTSNGRIIKWKDPFNNAIVFEWDEDIVNGSHYHALLPQWNEKHDGVHYAPGTFVPEPWNSIYFGD